MKIEFKLSDKEKTLARFHSDEIGLFVAETCARYMDKYVPKVTGMLAQNYHTEPFKVNYDVVYARRLYYGDGFNFSTEMNVNATSHWDEAMITAHRGEIAKEITEYIKTL